MRLLLDTHVLLWAAADPGKLSIAVRQAVEEPSNEILLSAASAWEIATKNALGKLPLSKTPEQFVADALDVLQATELPVTIRHATAAAALPNHHRDPFDRLLVAQAIVEGLVLATADSMMIPHGAPVLRAAHRR